MRPVIPCNSRGIGAPIPHFRAQGRRGGRDAKGGEGAARTRRRPWRKRESDKGRYVPRAVVIVSAAEEDEDYVDSDLADAVEGLKAIFQRRKIDASFGKAPAELVD